MDQILKTLKNETSLTPEEDSLLTAIASALEKLESGVAPNDEQIVQQFLKQMPGPLARKYMKESYSSGDRLQFDKAAADIQSGNLDSLLTLSNMKRFTKFNSFTRPFPSDRWVYDDYKLPVNEVEPNLETMEDFTNLKSIYRDGPPSKDLERLASGDLMEYVYREKRRMRGTKNPKEREVYIMLYDMSGSMRTNSKYIFQAALMASVVDSAQLKIAQGNKISFIAIPFSDSPGVPTKIDSLAEAMKFFNTAMREPPTGNGGTSITSAIKKGFEMIKKSQEEGGELGKAHIMILTDGADQIDFRAVESAKAELMQKTAISFHAITMGEGNKDLKKLTDAGLKNSQKGKSSYQFFSFEQIAQLMSSVDNIESLKNGAKKAIVKSGVGLSSQDVAALTGRVSTLGLVAEKMNGAHRDIMALDLELHKSAIEQNDFDLSQYVAPVLLLDVGQNLSPIQKKTTRLNFLSLYFDSLAKDLKITKEDVQGYLSQQQKSDLLNWISN